MYEKESRSGDENNTILNAIIIACIIGIAIVAVLIFTTEKDDSFTELYLLDYTKSPVNDSLLIEYGISNHENADVEYTVLVLVDNETVLVESVSLAEGIIHEGSISVPFVNMTDDVHKIAISLDGREEEVHFWTETI